MYQDQADSREQETQNISWQKYENKPQHKDHFSALGQTAAQTSIGCPFLKKEIKKRKEEKKRKEISLKNRNCSSCVHPLSYSTNPPVSQNPPPESWWTCRTLSPNPPACLSRILLGACPDRWCLNGETMADWQTRGHGNSRHVWCVRDNAPVEMGQEEKTRDREKERVKERGEGWRENGDRGR